MSWLKIDDDVVGADEPLDAFLLQGMERNVNAALADRPSSVGFSWPDGKRPILACADTVAVLLGDWTLTPRFDSIELHLHHTVADAPVNLALTVLTQRGVRTAGLTFTSVAPGVGLKTVLELDGLRQFWGRTITLILLINSDEGDHATGSPSTCRVRPSGGKVTITSMVPTITLNAADRHTLSVNPDPAGGGGQDDEGFPFPVTLQAWRVPDPATLVTYIWPWLNRNDAQWDVTYGDVELSVLKLGQSEVYGYSIVEASPVEYPPLTSSLKPGRSPVAARIGQLYANNRQTFEGQARMLHVGPVWDPADTDNAGDQRCIWGPMVPHDTASWTSIGSTLIGNYDHSVQDPAGAATNQIRSTIIVEGYLMAMYANQRYNRDLLVDLRVELTSFAGGAWAASAVLSDELVDIPIRSRVRNFLPWDDLTSQIWSFGQQGAYFQHSYLRWAWPISELSQPDQAGLTPFRLEVVDTEIAATDRLLILSIKGQTPDQLGRRVVNDPGSKPYYCCPAFSVRIKPGLGEA
jgi:hypothetical protein